MYSGPPVLDMFRDFGVCETVYRVIGSTVSFACDENSDVLWKGPNDGGATYVEGIHINENLPLDLSSRLFTIGYILRLVNLQLTDTGLYECFDNIKKDTPVKTFNLSFPMLLSSSSPSYYRFMMLDAVSQKLFVGHMNHLDILDISDQPVFQIHSKSYNFTPIESNLDYCKLSKPEKSMNTIRELSTNVKSLTETVKSQRDILKTVMNLQKNATGSDLSCTSTQNQSSYQIIETQGNGDSRKVSAGMFPHIQTVSQTQRQHIKEGKYINLVSLLIPVNENQSDTQQIVADGSILLLKPKDHRLQRDLSIHEYIEAFNIYKNIVCEFEDCRVELDMFLQNIIEMATNFKGNIFFEYHKAFAKKVAAIKLTKVLTVDWSIRDEKLYSSVCLGRAINTCGVCGSSLHSTEMCYLSDTSQGKSYHSLQKRIPTIPYSQPQSVDIDPYGRPKLFHKGKEICNYYLAGNCYRGSTCRYAHVDMNIKSSTQIKPSIIVSKTVKQANI
ncbi:unnamed protein product [Mytilus coruscus]|uniref:C3H1-type domain-containing protein n=1 Tax=Mytilus coruscus TaxID=42192 RepID=A0A6J8CPD2_MYTCO|nr:unnamed protein product [Mytilus coruscus]